MNITVLMVTYNHEKFIKDAINAIFNQTYKNNFNFIIGDDASCDKTSDIIKSMISEVPAHINCNYYRHNENLTGVENFNFCLSKIEDGLVIIADGDDISKLDRIDKIVKIHKLMNKSLYISNADEIDVNNNSLNRKRYVNNFNLDNIDYSDIYTNKVPVFGAAYAFDYSIIQTYGLIDTIYVTKNNVDQNLFWRAIKDKGVYYIDEALLYYRSHMGGTSISRRRDNAKLNGYKVEEKLLTIKINMNIIGNLLYIINNELINNKKLDPLFFKIHNEFSNLQNLLSDLDNMNYDIKIEELESINQLLKYLIDTTEDINNMEITPILLNSLSDNFLNRNLHTLEIVELINERTILSVIKKFNYMFKDELQKKVKQVTQPSFSEKNLFLKSFNIVSYNGKDYFLKIKSLTSIKIINFIDVINYILNGKKILKNEFSQLLDLFKNKEVTKREIVIILMRENNIGGFGPFKDDYLLRVIFLLKYRNIVNIQKKIFRK